MKITGLQTTINHSLDKPSEMNNKTGFQEMLKDSLNRVNDLQLEADNTAVSFAAGAPDVDFHDVTIGMEKAYLALQLTIEIRNKLVEAYQEVMRMQV